MKIKYKNLIKNFYNKIKVLIKFEQILTKKNKK